jgi:hypothetical protein
MGSCKKYTRSLRLYEQLFPKYLISKVKYWKSKSRSKTCCLTAVLLCSVLVSPQRNMRRRSKSKYPSSWCPYILFLKLNMSLPLYARHCPSSCLNKLSTFPFRQTLKSSRYLSQFLFSLSCRVRRRRRKALRLVACISIWNHSLQRVWSWTVQPEHLSQTSGIRSNSMNLGDS